MQKSGRPGKIPPVDRVYESRLDKSSSRSGIYPGFRLPPPDQPRQFAPAAPNPFAELVGRVIVLLAVDLAAQSRALESATAQVEGEGCQRIEPPVGERNVDQPQHRPLGDGDITSEQGLGFLLGDRRS